MTRIATIGKYACQWHEGALIITLRECLKDANDWPENASKYNQYYPVNYCWEVGPILVNQGRCKVHGDFGLGIHLNRIEQLNLAIFCVLSSYYQDQDLPFDDWDEVFIAEKKQNKRKIPGRVRQNVLMRDNYTCQICGATVKDGAKLEIDHIVPFSKGGSNDENNLQVLCQQCNREKHNRTDLLHDKKKLEELSN